MDWIHWIGKQYYTMNSFAKEAKEHSVSRRVSLQTAKQMAWGDTVYCTMLDGKTGVIFGSFTIERITGLSEEATIAALATHETENINDGEEIIKRGCGSYATGPSWQVDASIADIIETVEEVKDDGRDEGQIMVAGTFVELEKTRLLDIPFRQGFRKFDSQAFLEAVNNGITAVHGQFYVDSNIAEPAILPDQHRLGQVQQIKDYKRNPNKRKKRQHKAHMTIHVGGM